MEKQKSNIWIGGLDLANDREFIENAGKEFVEEPTEDKSASVQEVAENIGSNRRDFLKFLGFGLGAATVAAGCDIPVKRAIPYVIKPEQIIPGVATYYASTFVSGGESLPILVKTREGRPIKIEGNGLSKMTNGGTSARAQASVLSLYDTSRYRMPAMKMDDSWADAEWSKVDETVGAALKNANGVRVITNTVLSPTKQKAMNEFAAAHNAEIVTYDPVSASALLDATEAAFGQRVIPDYDFAAADMIVSFGADFLGTWISPVEYAAAYVKGRKIKDVKNPKMSRHIQVEAGMTMTGSNADNRILVKPSEQGAAIAYLANKIVGGVSTPALNPAAKKALDKLAADLQRAKGKSLIVSGSNNVTEQKLVHAINNALGNIGNTVKFGNVSLARKGDDKAVAKLLSDMKSGRVDVLIINEANPAYDLAQSAEFVEALAKVKTKISLAVSPNETTVLSDVIAPVHHSLEAWGDVEPKRGVYSFLQPTIKNLFTTRQAGHTFLTWANSPNLDKNAEQPYLDYIKDNWRATGFASQSKFMSFNSYWDNLVKDGVYHGSVSDAAPSFSGDVSGSVTKPSSSELEISFYEPITIGNGQYSNNPWLIETPDPVTRTSWGNYLAVPVAFDGVRRFAGFQDLKDGDLVDITIGDKTMTVPVVQQFGQMPGTVSLALGYGREVAGRAGAGVGVNVNDCLTVVNGMPHYYNTNVSVGNSKGQEDHFSCVQYHHTIGVTAEEKSTGETINADEAALVFFDYFTGVKGFQGSLTDRSVIYNTNVKDLKEDLAELHEKRAHAQHLNEQQIYGGFDNSYEMGHHWGMHVDLNSCIGCAACTVACMSENNVPVVGKKEVSRHHEMTWLRIDRYYYGDVTSPNTIYQPMMCQHCDNAPCENVCPVNASNHSSEGLNQMAYNRCIGTRYCANNCPYKVRRFNWLDFTTADLFPGNQPKLTADEEIPFYAENLTRMVLNPDVTVRSRGVIEKCSFCVQRLQEGKLTAKIEGRRLNDSDVQTACQTACPTGAITFGDMNNKKGELTEKLANPLNYIALEEVNVRSSVTYTMKVNNRDEALDA